MHYYQFNIGDYKSHTSGLSIIEDIAYRRLLDIYYLNERPFSGCSTDVAREIGMREYAGEVEYVLSKFFTQKGSGDWENKRAKKEIENYRKKKRLASAAGRASGKARRSKGSERTFDSVQPTINHKPLTSNQEPRTENHEPPGNDFVASVPAKQKPSTNNHSSLSSDEDHELANFIWSKIERLAAGQKKPNLATWANDLRKMRTLDGRTTEEIRDIFMWANSDSFWQSNIRSPKKLRDQFDHLKIKRRTNGSGVCQDIDNAVNDWLSQSNVIEGELA